MADDTDSGDKTEKPTPKKLADARKKGQVPKSRDVTSTVELLVWCALALLATGYVGTQLGALMEAALQVAHQPFALALPRLIDQAALALLAVSAVLLLPVIAVGLVSEYLQAGPVFALDRVMPKLENMNPVEGVKKMFTLDALIELLKAATKSAALLLIGWLAVVSLLPQLALLPQSHRPEFLGTALMEAARPVLVWTVLLCTLIAVLDVVYQRFSFTKRMRMSMRDIRQEMKDSEGDPYIKQQRKQQQEEWTQRNATAAARNANVLVVNPTHVAIAIDYDRETCPVPTIAAKGEDHVARAMREAAEEAGVPVVRNVPLARDLLARAEIGELIPPDLFDVIAEVVLWAREVRDELAHPATEGEGEADARRAAPGEDLSRYPDRRTAEAEG